MACRPARVVGGYYGSWAGYRSGHGRLEPEGIDPSLCTHLYYGFAGPTPDGEIKVQDEWNDLPSGKDFYGRFNALKKRNPHLKTLVAVGGWNEGSTRFSAVAGDPVKRRCFALSAVQFCARYGFDGVDIDWEYPADSGQGGSSSDKEGFVRLLEALHSTLKPRGLLLTAAVGVGASRIDSAYDVPRICQYLDLINLMTYDFHGHWETRTGHNAPLARSSADATAESQTMNVDFAVRNWIRNGAPPNKLCLGVAAYGRSFALASPRDTGLGAPVTGAGSAGPHTKEAGSLAYYEICSNPSWNVVWDDVIKAPYAYTGSQWVGFDNVISADLKTQYADNMGLAGTFLWSLDMDDFHGISGEGRYPILSSIYNSTPKFYLG